MKTPKVLNYRREIVPSCLETTVSSLNVGLGWTTAVATLETRSRAMSTSKEPGRCLFSARNTPLPSMRPSKLPRRLSRGLGVEEYALWKSVSESSVVPVRAGVRAGVTGCAGVLDRRSAAASSEIGAPSFGAAVRVVAAATAIVVVVGGGLTSPFLTGFSAPVGVLTSSGLEEFSLRVVSFESRRVTAVLLDVTVSPRFLGPLGSLLTTPEAFRERGRVMIVRPSVPSLSLSGPE